jgi:hypothetical protein
VGYVWPSWALAALQGIEPGEVLQVLNAPRRWPRVGRSDLGLNVLTIWGRTRAGRPLPVAVRPTGEWDFEILGARPLRPDQVAELQKWEESDD